MRHGGVMAGRGVFNRDDIACVSQPNLLLACARAQNQPQTLGARCTHKPVRHGGRPDQRQQKQRACYEAREEQGLVARMVHLGMIRPVGRVDHEFHLDLASS